MSRSPGMDTAALLERGWAALPPSYRPPAAAPSLDDALAYCRRLAHSHYENFHVASWFLPRALRPHFYAVYAYCRIADDLGDEAGGPDEALALLDLWGRELDACYAGVARHPVFVALRETIRACSIPREPFADLLIAFRQDQTVHRYATMNDVLGYCRHSANPVGRLVLHLAGQPDAESLRLSDAICTGLQLANFWQDVRRDYALGRVYLPQDDLRRFGVDEACIAAGAATPEFRALLRSEVAYAHALFDEGAALPRRLRGGLSAEIDLICRGGRRILRAIERQDYDVLSRRPSLSTGAKVSLAARAVAAKAVSLFRP